MSSYKNHLKIIAIASVLAIIVFVLQRLPAFNLEVIRARVLDAGVWGPVVIIIYTILSHVIAPISGSPMLVVSFSIYGSYAFAFYYIAGMTSSTISFFISRKLGRKWVAKLSGKKNLERIDRAVSKSGVKMLIIARIIGFPFFDVISYAAGLTNISFRQYFLITALGTFVPQATFAFFLRNAEVTLTTVLIAGSIILGIAIVFGALIYRMLR